ncbi:hypothetical protein [Nocardioides sp.]|uniref:hypothetical protein n=1 Tax=Nocardioides sp. TaxID=35761 RepID=UPI0037849D0D
MSIRTRFAAFLVVLAAVAISLAPVAADATRSTPSARIDVLPKIGHYEGRDTHHRHIKFYYGSHGRVVNFRVEHTNFPPAEVQGAMWHRTCHNNHCTRGHWTTDTHVNGHWSISTSSLGDVAFSARWISH